MIALVLPIFPLGKYLAPFFRSYYQLMSLGFKMSIFVLPIDRGFWLPTKFPNLLTTHKPMKYLQF
jgi:hypothetical protein